MALDEVAAEGQKPPKDKSLTGRAKAAVRSFRWWMLLPLPALLLVLQGFGPDGWREPVLRMLWLSTACILAAMTHAFRRILLPFLDLSDLYERAKNGNTAAGLVAGAVLVMMGMVFSGLVSLAKAEPIDAKTYVPTNARALLPALKEQQRTYWPEHAFPSYFGALIEQESCVSLTNSRCWNARAQLKTSREEGGGLGQFTRAYGEDGRLRFDAIAEVRALDPEGLREFTWSTVYARADLSMRAILVKVRDMDRRLAQQAPQMTAFERLAMIDAAYNGGFGGMLADRRLCAATPRCDPNRWFGGVEATSSKSRTPWQGYGKSAFAINREHVLNAVILRRPKYRAALGDDLA